MSRLFFILSMIFCFTLSACAVPIIKTEVPSTEMPFTLIPIATITPTLTHTPEPTFTPTIAPTPTETYEIPQVVLDRFEEVTIEDVDRFANLDNWDVYPNADVRTIDDGKMKIISAGKEAGCSGFQLYSLEEGMGVLFRFQYHKSRDWFGFYLYSDQYDTDRYKEFGVSTYDGILNAYLMKGKQWSPLHSFSGSGKLPLKQDIWYNVLDAVGSSGTFYTAIWDDNDPPHIASKYFDGKGTQGWNDLTWKFSVCADRRAILYLDDFAVFTFKDLKVKK